MIKKIKLNKLQGIIILIFIFCSVMYYLLNDISQIYKPYYYFIVAPILLTFLVLLILEIIKGSGIKPKQSINSESLLEKNTKQQQNTENIKELSQKQYQLLFDFLKTWFIASTREDIQNLITLNFHSIKGELKLIKTSKSFSLLFFKLSEKGYYSRNQIDSIFDCKNVIPTKGKYFNREVFSKYHSLFEKGKSIDVDKEYQNITLLLKSF